MHLLKSVTAKTTGLAAGLFILLGAAFCGLLFGRTTIPAGQAMSFLTAYDDRNMEHIILLTERVPRAVIATAVGASLAVAGCFMQALTRNPLASPSTFGVNAGAIFAVVVGVVFLSIPSMGALMWFAFGGAALAGVLVYALGSAGGRGLTPVKIVLAGAAIHAIFTSFTQATLVLNEAGMQNVLFWLAGSVSGRSLNTLLPLLPLVAAALAVSFAMGKSVNVMASGDELSKGLGQRTAAVKAVMGAIVVVLSGSAVAVAGAVGFVGLIVPHLARGLVGADYRWSVPYSAVLGAVLLVSADVASRLMIAPQEVPIGVITAMLGVPFFVYLARRGANSR